MRFQLTLLSLLIVTCVGGVPLEVAGQGYYPGRQAGARVWIENDRDFFRRGDRMDVRFTLSDDAYVAIVHVDPEGYLDFVYPASPWDNEYVRGGRVHTLPYRGGSWQVGNRSGIGYFYLIASPRPLEFSNFRGGIGSPWDWGYAGRVIRGDPFLAFQQIADLLLPWGDSPYVYDSYGYHVGGIHRYPSYACSDQRYGYGWGWTPSYGSCSRMDYFLRDYPYYYDTRRYRGDRRDYIGRYDRFDPLHGFKEDPERSPTRGVTPRPQPDRRPSDTTGRGVQPPGGSSREVERRDPLTPGAEPRSTREPAARPAPERTREPATRAAPDRPATRDTREQPTSPAPDRPASNRGSEPRARPEPSSGSRRAAPEPSARATSSGRRPAVGQP